MASSITDLLDRVSDSNSGRPIIASMAAPGKAIGAASINLDATTNWTTTTAIHFSIYTTTVVGSTVIKDATSQTDWKGTLSGTSIGNLTLTGGTDRAYTAGAIVELTPTSRWAKDMYDWAIAGHNQDGTHRAFTETNIVPTAAIQDSAITTAKLANTSVTAAKIEAQQAWQTPTFQNGWVNYDTVNWEGAAYMKDSLGFVHLRGMIKSGTMSAAAFTLPVGYRAGGKGQYFPTLAGGAVIGAVYTDSTGIMKPDAGNNTYQVLNGITFRAEG